MVTDPLCVSCRRPVNVHERHGWDGRRLAPLVRCPTLGCGGKPLLDEGLTNLCVDWVNHVNDCLAQEARERLDRCNWRL